MACSCAIENNYVNLGNTYNVKARIKPSCLCCLETSDKCNAFIPPGTAVLPSGYDAGLFCPLHGVTRSVGSGVLPVLCSRISSCIKRAVLT